MSKLSKETMYTELSILIGVLEAKVDKILELLLENRLNVMVDPLEIKGLGNLSEKDIDKNIAYFRQLSSEEFDEAYK
jgi:hypothetical protein